MAGTTEMSQIASATRRLDVGTRGKSWERARAWPAIQQFIVTKPLGAIGGGIIVLMALAAIFADVVAPYDPYAIDVALQFGPPNLAHWLGTDEFGRDVLTRLIYGARIALFIGFAASFLGCTGGALIGVVSAYLGGKTDLIVQRLMDVLLAFPLLILASDAHSPVGQRHSGGSLLELSGTGDRGTDAVLGVDALRQRPPLCREGPWMAVFPGLAISLAVFGFNLFGDSLHDALDPKLRHRT